jgi:hypothetical protein
VLNLAGPTRWMPEELAANRVLVEAVVQAAGGAMPVLAASSAAVYGARAAAGLELPKCLNLALPGVVGLDALLATAGEG